jgi:hypothetical protein
MNKDQRDVSHIDEGEINEPIGNTEQLNAIELANELKDFHNDNSNSMYDICFNSIYKD